MNTTLDTRPGTDATERRIGIGGRLLAAAALVATMLAGILVLGRLASDDLMAMALTTVFFVVLAAALGWLVWRRRELMLPLGVTYVVVAGGAGVLLGLPLITDDVVGEDVIRVEAGASGVSSANSANSDEQDSGQAAGSETGSAGEDGTGPADSEPTDAEPAGPTEVASGQFESRVHPGEGTATLIDTADGSTVLTLTDFATDNGPDLLVYLVPADAPEGSVDGFVDLGRLKGNIGDQQYEVPADVDAGEGWRVVVWCRAFAVTFTEATLA